MATIVFGYIMIALGLIMIGLAVYVWFIEKTKPEVREMTRDEMGWLELLKALLEKAPWVAVVGLLLILFGMVLVGVIDIGALTGVS
jgi:Na+/melibiose symporter-like transporter